MSAPILITGSMAFDTIMVFRDQFRRHILPEQMHMLNVCFMVPELRREFGGCAGNIAYNLNLLGAPGLPMATVGQDFAPYRARLKAAGIDDRFITEVPDTYTAQAFVTTDLENNQLTAFHPGAMDFAERNKVTDAPRAALGIVSPDGRQAMLEHAGGFKTEGIPFFFDPGQGLPMFSRDELRGFLDQADYLVVNDYEWELFQHHSELEPEAVRERLKALIVTRGGEGVSLYAGKEEWQVPPIPIGTPCDPTGCGDAFRAGLLYGVSQGWDWLATARLGNLLGGIKLEHPGSQNHAPSREQLRERFKQAYGCELPLP